MESGSKRYTVILTDEASQMLVTHARFLARVNEKAADDLIAEFIEKAGTLEYLPERHPFVEDSYLPVQKYRMLPLGKWLLLVYSIKGDKVYIDYVLDCRRDGIVKKTAHPDDR
jgi:hypothetical protein